MVIVGWHGSGSLGDIFDKDVFKTVLTIFITSAYLTLLQGCDVLWYFLFLVTRFFYFDVLMVFLVLFFPHGVQRWKSEGFPGTCQSSCRSEVHLCCFLSGLRKSEKVRWYPQPQLLHEYSAAHAKVCQSRIDFDEVSWYICLILSIVLDIHHCGLLM